MTLSELTKLMQDTLSKDGDCTITAGQMRTPEGKTVLTVVIPERRVLHDQSQG